MSRIYYIESPSKHKYRCVPCDGLCGQGVILHYLTTDEQAETEPQYCWQCAMSEEEKAELPPIVQEFGKAKNWPRTAPN